MAEWITKKLKDIVDFNPRESLAKGAIAKKIAMDKLQPFCRDIPEYELTPFSGGTKFRNGDTIMARITPCLENGKTAKVNILDDEEVGFGSTEYIVFRAKDGVDEDFVYYLVCSPLVREPAIKSMVGSSGRQRVQTDVVQNLNVLVPPYDVQKRISGLLKSLDDKIAENAKINKNLEQQAQAMFKSWFVDFEPFGGTVPEGWHLRNLSVIADFISGYSYKGNELIESSTAMATIKNFDRNGGFKLDGFKEIVPSDKLKSTQHIERFDILVAHTDLTQKAEIIGNAEIVMSLSGYRDAIFSMDLVKVVPKKETVSKFLLAFMLRNPIFKTHCLGYVNGTTVLHLSKRALPEYELILPNNLSELKPLDEAITALYLKISINIEENVRLAELRDTLLPKLMSSELDVSDFDL